MLSKDKLFFNNIIIKNSFESRSPSAIILNKRHLIFKVSCLETDNSQYIEISS